MNLLNAPLTRQATSSPSAVSDTGTERKDKDWSSLPVLLLWMVKDKLDIFGNACFSAVCRGWRSASNTYPKVLQSVADGLPWITSTSSQGNSLEFFSVARLRKLKVNMPEIARDAEQSFLFSKQGWIFVRRCNRRSKHAVPDSLFLVNLFTMAKIELPPCSRNTGWDRYRGCFTTDIDGYPQRVFLLVSEYPHSVAIFKTLSAGDGEWKDHTFRGTEFSSNGYFITIGDFVYSLDWNYQIKAFNVSDQTLKELPPPTNTCSQSGFIGEHQGELIFVQHVYDHDDKSPYIFSSFKLYRYDNVASLWKTVRNDDVKNTTWFYHTDYGCIATKGKGGLKIYLLSDERKSYLTQYRIRVEVYDLLTGNNEILQVPSLQGYDSVLWVDLG